MTEHPTDPLGDGISTFELARLWDKVRFTAVCWEWTGAMVRGYGHIRIRGRDLKVHRLVCELTHGPIPPGLFALHSCNNPRCVRPAHLHPGTRAENQAQMVRDGRAARGERHGLRLHPERVARGDQNGSRTHHEQCGRLTQAQISELRALYAVRTMPRWQLAQHYGITVAHLWRVATGRVWA